jgi:hypothetical protein
MSHHDDGVPLRPVLRPRWLRFHLSTVLGLVVVVALILAVWIHERQQYVPWHRAGGMIGWSQARMVAQLGQPAHTFEKDVAHAEAHSIRPSPPTGPFRTLVFRTVDGQFVAWFSGAGGTYTCFRSTWVEKNTYY